MDTRLVSFRVPKLTPSDDPPLYSLTQPAHLSSLYTRTARGHTHTHITAPVTSIGRPAFKGSQAYVHNDTAHSALNHPSPHQTHINPLPLFSHCHRHWQVVSSSESRSKSLRTFPGQPQSLLTFTDSAACECHSLGLYIIIDALMLGGRPFKLHIIVII